jgi:hypothetical protein
MNHVMPRYLLKLWTLLPLFVVTGFQDLAAEGSKLNSYGELERINKSSVSELLAFLSQRERHVSVPQPRSRAGWRRVSVWGQARVLLRAKLEEARPGLLAMLEDENNVNARANALYVLSRDGPAHRRPLRGKVITLLDDPAMTVRTAAINYLSPIKNEEVRAAFVHRIQKLIPTEGNWITEVGKLVEKLCQEPTPEETLVPILIRIMDHPRANSWLLSTTIQQSRPYSRKGPFADQLLERYWKILSSTANSSVPYHITGSLTDDDDRTLPYLRGAASIENDQARRYAASKLISHDSFDVKIDRDRRLLDQLLADDFILVRRETVRALSERGDIDPQLQIAATFQLYHSKVPEGVLTGGDIRGYAISALFAVLCRLPEEARSEVLRDARYSIPELMIAGLGNEKLSWTVIHESGPFFEEDLSSISKEEAHQKALALWRLHTLVERKNEIQK